MTLRMMQTFITLATKNVWRSRLSISLSQFIFHLHTHNQLLSTHFFIKRKSECFMKRILSVNIFNHEKISSSNMMPALNSMWEPLTLFTQLVTLYTGGTTEMLFPFSKIMSSRSYDYIMSWWHLELKVIQSNDSTWTCYKKGLDLFTIMPHE